MNLVCLKKLVIFDEMTSRRRYVIEGQDIDKLDVNAILIMLADIEDATGLIFANHFRILMAANQDECNTFDGEFTHFCAAW